MGHLTRFGVNFEQGDIKGKFEVDARAGGAGATGNMENDSGASRLGNMRLRHLWGEWNFGSGKLMVGQNYPLFDAAISGIAYQSGGLQQYGGIGYGVARTSQIRLTFGNLKIAFLPPDTATGSPSASSTTVATAPPPPPGGTVTTTTVVGYDADIDTTLPKIEVRYLLKFDPVALDFIGGWQNYEIVNANDDSQDITSWVAAVRAKCNFGMAYLNLQVNYRQNGTNYGVWTVANEAAQYSTDVEDATALNYGVALGYKISDQFKIEVSYSKINAENDLNNYEDDAQAYGILLAYHPAPGVLIQPEIIFEDMEDTVTSGVSTEQAENTIFGVFWLINFK
jgi:hypothetical protein